MDMIEIDGSQGEGGGQILRTALSLSAMKGEPVKITNIRANRGTPGLKRQHLTAARAVAEICNGALSGDEVGSSVLTLEPRAIRGGDYRFAVGTAGSVTLVAQTVIPVLLRAEHPSTVVIEGGTHVHGAPIFEFFNETYLPQLRKMGFAVEATLEKHGFFPAGGGRIRLEIAPYDYDDCKQYKLLTTGTLKSAEVVAYTAGIDTKIAKDEAEIIAHHLKDLNPAITLREIDAVSAGNVAYVRLEYENITEIFSAIGTMGLSRKSVALKVVRQVKNYLKTGHPVDEFLADQLLLPMLALNPEQGIFNTGEPSCHFTTNVDVLKNFNYHYGERT